MSLARNNVYKALFVLVGALLPLLGLRFSIVPTLLTLSLYYAIVASNWNLLFGYGGIWSFGQLGFFAIGAYSSALLSKAGTSPWIAMLIGVGISVSLALVLSIATLRLKAIYFGLTTFGFATVVSGLLIVIYPAGIVFDVPPLTIGGFSFDSFGGISYYYAFLVLFLATLYVHKKLLKSRIGIMTLALRDNETRAISLGVEPLKVRMILFLVSVIFTSLVGSLYAEYTGNVSQAILGYDLFLTYLIILALGGIGTFWGPSIASFLWVFLDFFLRLYLAQWRLIIMGALVVLSLLFLRTGLSGLYDSLIRWSGEEPSTRSSS